MFGISTLKNAVLGLANNLTALAGTVGEINAGLRQRAALDGPDPADGPLTLGGASVVALPAKASGVAQDTRSAAEVDSTDPPAANATRNGRRKAAAASGT